MSVKNPWEGKPSRDPTRIDATIEALRGAWKRDPDMRLGQLLLNVTRNDEGDTDKRCLWSMEAEELRKKLREWENRP